MMTMQSVLSTCTIWIDCNVLSSGLNNPEDKTIRKVIFVKLVLQALLFKRCLFPAFFDVSDVMPKHFIIFLVFCTGINLCSHSKKNPCNDASVTKFTITSQNNFSPAALSAQIIQIFFRIFIFRQFCNELLDVYILENSWRITSKPLCPLFLNPSFLSALRISIFLDSSSGTEFTVRSPAFNFLIILFTSEFFTIIPVISLPIL